MSALSEIPVKEFLERVKAQGIHLEANGDRIHVGWPEKTPDPEIRQAIIDRKPKIMEALAEQQYYLDLLEIMRSPKYGLDQETAEQEAGEIIDEYRLRKKQRIKGNLK